MSKRTSAVRLHLEQLENRLVPAMTIGMNIDRVVDYNPDWMFTDAFLEARPWISGLYDTVTRSQTGGGTPHLDARGWPTLLEQSINALGHPVQQRLVTGMYANLSGHYPAGTYRAEWEGEATLVWSGDVVVRQQGITNGKHFANLDVTPTQMGIRLQVNAMDPTRPLHDLHVWVPDYNGQALVHQAWHPGDNFSPFHPLYVDRLRPFGTIRFMHAQNTVTSDIVHWSDRKPLDYAPQTTMAYTFQNGLAPEYMVELANELHANPWFCMPHLADDDFVRGFAQLVHAQLDATRAVYVEWSDELWNPSPGYEGHEWLQQQSALTGRSVFDLWASEMRRDFAIWSDVFADRPGQLVRVVAGQAVNTWTMNQVLPLMNGQFDAVSPDAYVTFPRPWMSQFNANTTVDQVVNALFQQGLPLTLQNLQNYKNLANQYSAILHRPIQTVAYEGGILLVAPGQPYEPIFRQTERDPRMYELYRQLLVGANAIGLSEFTDFIYTDTSPFAKAGKLEFQDQPLSEAHRYRAVADAVAGVFYTLTVLPNLGTTPGGNTTI